MLIDNKARLSSFHHRLFTNLTSHQVQNTTDLDSEAGTDWEDLPDAGPAMKVDPSFEPHAQHEFELEDEQKTSMDPPSVPYNPLRMRSSPMVKPDVTARGFTTKRAPHLRRSGRARDAIGPLWSGFVALFALACILFALPLVAPRAMQGILITTTDTTDPLAIYVPAALCSLPVVEPTCTPSPDYKPAADSAFGRMHLAIAELAGADIKGRIRGASALQNRALILGALDDFFGGTHMLSAGLQRVAKKLDSTAAYMTGSIDHALDEIARAAAFPPPSGWSQVLSLAAASPKAAALAAARAFFRPHADGLASVRSEIERVRRGIPQLGYALHLVCDLGEQDQEELSGKAFWGLREWDAVARLKELDAYCELGQNRSRAAEWMLVGLEEEVEDLRVRVETADALRFPTEFHLKFLRRRMREIWPERETASGREEKLR
ncbi:uncharacterized protein BXZ73DRAFT_103618 [Epithele typhae]|uniref:uncharacterized protein n=1 Tax=Epithele typhae TaxID=378194 RepID=UPI00200850A5|nr:uncharacterized protein BXZ73DRAFT_103618 [Epithele typhae]KAH9924327.1 hypothetical protein BXZ73DRAFT_103618 [Epithele typhae]